MMEHGEELLKSALDADDMSQIAITILCDSTDAWVVAAYDGTDDIETREAPWKTIIAKKKTYHGIRVRGDKKNYTQRHVLFPFMKIEFFIEVA